jgi:hypothetical protein
VRFRTRDADVEETAFFGDLLFSLRAAEGDFVYFDAWEDHGLELESLRAVIGKQHDSSACAVATEAALQVRREVAHRAAAVVELLGEANQSREVVLAGHLLLPQALGRVVEVAGALRDGADLSRDIS